MLSRNDPSLSNRIIQGSTKRLNARNGGPKDVEWIEAEFRKFSMSLNAVRLPQQNGPAGPEFEINLPSGSRLRTQDMQTAVNILNRSKFIIFDPLFGPPTEEVT